MSRLPFAVAVTTVAMFAAATGPATAATMTFGADLAQVPANNTPGTACKDGTWWNAVLLGLPLLGNTVPADAQGSCQFSSGGVNAGGSFGLAAPATGTVTAARVKVGNTTGPMRINVIRTLFQQTGDAANPSSSTPFLQAYGPTFTPQANAVTTVPLNLPVRAQAAPDINDTGSVAGTDWLALEVLAPDVPVPLALSSGAAAFFFAAFPGPTAGGVAAPSPNPLPNYGQLGLQVTMSADLTTTANATPGGRATVDLARTTASVVGGRALLDLLCKVRDCAGSVTLGPVSSGGKTTTYGRATFSGKAGKQVRVRVKLTTKGRTLLRRKRKAKVRAVVVLDGVAATTKLTVTLKR
ncbi:MAG: hypothetical protein JHC84_05285 [Solirubrobacteraceae bacterium]|nr:hypothetical protein [Solirubrobacteraceae bacterium]